LAVSPPCSADRRQPADRRPAYVAGRRLCLRPRRPDLHDGLLRPRCL